MSRVDEIQELISRLRYGADDESIDFAMKALVKIEEAHINLLFFRANKSEWENCAIVLERIGFPKLDGFLSKILEWYQDLNWPGIPTITSLLGKAKRETLLPILEGSILEAAGQGDEQWVGGLKRLIEKLGIEPSAFKNENCRIALRANDFYGDVTE